MTTVTATPHSLHALLRNLIDYAGLFPPAKLDMESTVRNYARYLHGDHASIISRLIVPVSKLDDFIMHATPLLPKSEESPPWLISALTAAGDDEALIDELTLIAAFNEAHEVPAAGLARIDVIELRASSTSAIECALDAISDEIFPFFELPHKDDPRGLIASLAGSDAGAKIRTGGVTADAFPTAPEVARFIAACAQASVPFKATAGLHHPVRLYHESVKTKMFGFFNVFIAALLARRNDWAADQLIPILKEESPQAFSFTDEHCAWRDQTIPVEIIEDNRNRFAISFGSCSIQEPVEDLQALNLLES